MNSLVWEYLQSMDILIDATEIFVPRALDGPALKQWLEGLQSRRRSQKFVFRKADDGKFLLLPEGFNLPEQGEVDDKYFSRMASYCLGLPQIALLYWRSALRVTPDVSLSEDELETEEDVDATMVWVLPWEKVAKPILSALTSDEEAILWSVLLHERLSRNELKSVLGATFQGLNKTLQGLVLKQLLQMEEGVFMVNPLSYPAIVQLLANEGYLMDRVVE